MKKFMAAHAEDFVVDRRLVKMNARTNRDHRTTLVLHTMIKFKRKNKEEKMIVGIRKCPPEAELVVCKFFKITQHAFAVWSAHALQMNIKRFTAGLIRICP